MPAREATVICGSYTVDWNKVKYAATWFVRKASYVRSQKAFQMPHVVDGVSETVAMNLRWVSRSGSESFAPSLGQKIRAVYRWDLLSLLTTFRTRAASDPKDKLFAFLGLSADQEDPSMQPDYSLSPAEIFRNATRFVIRRAEQGFYGNLSVLQHVAPHSEEPNWPSCVPDWRVEDTSDVASMLTGFRACGSTRHRQHDTADPDTLRCEGAEIGVVIYASPHRHAGELYTHLREEYSRCAELLSSYPTGEDLMTVLGRTLIRDQLPKQVEIDGADLNTYARNTVPFADAIYHMPRTNVTEKIARNEKMQHFMDTASFRQDFNLQDSYCERRLFVTNNAYMGIGDHHLIEGDSVSILFGSEVPFILRPSTTDSGYRLIGEAYCHGVMNAELVDSLPQNEKGLALGRKVLLR